MARTLISDIAFEPLLASEYAAAHFIENTELLAALGVIKIIGVDSLKSNTGQGGEYVDMPRFSRIASIISKRDLTSVSAPTDLKLAAITERAVIQRKKAGPFTFSEDIYIRGLNRESAELEIGRQIGQAAAVNTRDVLHGLVIAALDQLASTVHTDDVYATSGTKGKLTVTEVVNGMMKMGDAYSTLSLLICHSDSFADLIADNIGTYKIDTVGGMRIASGFVHPRLLGLRILVVDDTQFKVTNSSNFKIYYSLLLGGDALGLIYARQMTVNAERRLDGEAPYWRILGNYDIAPHLFGFKWNTTANPTDAAIKTAANWTQTAEDHREVRAVKIKHNATTA